MAKRLKIIEGDIFEVKLEDDKKGYFQFVMLDKTQLNSEVIRVFQKQYDIEEEVVLEKMVLGEVQQFTHVMIKSGVKMGLWDKVGNVIIEPSFEIPYFRGSNDYGNPNIKKSSSWYIWKANEEFIQVGKLKDKHVTYHIGAICSPIEIPEIMNTGKSSFFYPSY